METNRDLTDWIKLFVSVADPNPDPPDPHVFGPPGSGSISQRYGSGYGSFYHQTKIVRKTLIPTASVTSFDFLSLKMMYTKMYLEKVLISKKLFFLN
jgi:hypothetical protein